jgi:hypothetical protein
MEDPAHDRAERRLEKSVEAVATFARIGEEFLAIRAATAPGPARDRIDRMIQLNQETLAAVKRSLIISESDLARQRPTD